MSVEKRADSFLILPLFVRAGAIVPEGTPIESTEEAQKIAKVLVYPGADGNFTLYQDDGETYDYEEGDYKLTQLYWDDVGHRFTHKGATAWTKPDSSLVNVIGSN